MSRRSPAPASLSPRASLGSTPVPPERTCKQRSAVPSLTSSPLPPGPSEVGRGCCPRCYDKPQGAGTSQRCRLSGSRAHCPGLKLKRAAPAPPCALPAPPAAAAHWLLGRRVAPPHPAALPSIAPATCSRQVLPPGAPAGRGLAQGRQRGSPTPTYSLPVTNVSFLDSQDLETSFKPTEPL